MSDNKVINLIFVTFTIIIILVGIYFIVNKTLYMYYVLTHSSSKNKFFHYNIDDYLDKDGHYHSMVTQGETISSDEILKNLISATLKKKYMTI